MREFSRSARQLLELHSVSVSLSRLYPSFRLRYKYWSSSFSAVSADEVSSLNHAEYWLGSVGGVPGYSWTKQSNCFTTFLYVRYLVVALVRAFSSPTEARFHYCTVRSTDVDNIMPLFILVDILVTVTVCDSGRILACTVPYLYSFLFYSTRYLYNTYSTST